MRDLINFVFTLFHMSQVTPLRRFLYALFLLPSMFLSSTFLGMILRLVIENHDIGIILGIFFIILFGILMLMGVISLVCLVIFSIRDIAQKHMVGIATLVLSLAILALSTECLVKNIWIS